LSIPGGDSFFVSSVKRALAVIGGEGRVVIIAGKSHVPHIVADITARGLFGPEDRRRMVLIPEPAAKNTAPAIACGTLYVQKALGPDRTILVLTSDHIIEPLPLFKDAAAAAAAFARQGKLAVFGIPPRGPETGYGYIEAGEALPLPPGWGPAGELPAGETPPGGLPAGAPPRVLRVAAFREKPDRERAERFIASGGFYWNAGMFGFSAPFMAEEFRAQAPEIIAPFARLAAPAEGDYSLREGLRVLERWDGLEAAYAESPARSFDYAIAENCAQTVAVVAGFDWFDVGSWDEYAKLRGDSPAELYLSGAEGCFVDSDIPVALCGVRDLVVVVRSGKDGGPPAVLVAQRGETQRVKEITEKIRAAGRTELL
jgi:mannose-1-phosphate guanylyltransferase